MTPRALARPILVDSSSAGADEVRNLREQLALVQTSVDRHQAELVRVRRDLAEAQAERDEAVGRAAVLEDEMANLAKLLVASSAIHASPDREEMLCALQEVVINLVGSEEFGVYEVSPSGLPTLLVGFGIDEAEHCVLPADAVFAHVRETGEIHVDIERAYPGSPAAVLPLCLGSEVRAMIVVFEFLSQKFDLNAFDYELYDLLGSQVVPALVATRGGEGLPA
jgi:hypothetical protein